MQERYGKMRGSTMSLITEAAKASRAKGWLDILPHIVPMFRDGDTLPHVESAWLSEWLASQGRGDLAPSDVQTVQLPRARMAELLGDHPERVSRALCALQVSGILTLVHKGKKGHASLYCVNPLPEPEEGAFAARAGDTVTLHTGDCERKYSHTSTKYSHTSGEIQSHHHPSDLGRDLLIIDKQRQESEKPLGSEGAARWYQTGTVQHAESTLLVDRDAL